jgi:hypothetical protein
VTTLPRDALYLLPLAIIGGLAIGGGWGVAGAVLALGLFALNLLSYAWLIPRVLAGGEWMIWVVIGFAGKTIGILLAYAGLALAFGPFPVAIGLVCGLGGVCIRRLLSPDDDDGSGYVGRPEGTGSKDPPR